MLSRIRSYILLPPSVSEFEAGYLKKINRVVLGFFVLHVPALTLFALMNGTGGLAALVLSAMVLGGPLVAHRGLSNPRHVSIVFGVAAMFFGGLLVHFGQGAVQIEMHFYFFALIAMLAVFGNPLVIVAAAATVAAHHLALWFLAPRSVFNYDAPVWVVAVHAGFVLMESAAAIYIARSFFDNVIGLENIVRARTRELDARNSELRRILDAVEQGMVLTDREGMIVGARSKHFDAVFGSEDGTVVDALARVSTEFAAQFALAWRELWESELPKELLWSQLPTTFAVGESRYELQCNPVGDPATANRFLVLVTDVTAKLEREQSEQERREILALLEATLENRPAARDYLHEASVLVSIVCDQEVADLDLIKRGVHTLKGNSAMIGAESIASLCHEIETELAEQGEVAPRARHRLRARWAMLAERLRAMVGDSGMVEVSKADLAALECSAGALSAGLRGEVRNLRLEPVGRRLQHFAERARRWSTVAGRGVDIVVEHDETRLEPARWSPFFFALIHAVRNAIDHGIEGPDERRGAGKPERGQLRLRATRTDGELLVEVCDDGRGIAWEQVRERARAMGLPTDTRADLESALMRRGLTTARQVTLTSGRGVGMAALQSATLALGGRLSIESTEGIGTRLTMRFPACNDAGDPHARAAA